MRGLDRDKGFTLVEMLCVVGLILILVGGFFRYSSKYNNKVRYMQAQEELAMLSGAVEYYKNEFGSYPTYDEKSLKEFYKVMAGVNKNKQNFVEGYDWSMLNDEILDPWGHPYVYQYKSESNRNGDNGSFYVLFSMGPNGEPESEEDFKNGKSDDIYSTH